MARNEHSTSPVRDEIPSHVFRGGPINFIDDDAPAEESLPIVGPVKLTHAGYNSARSLFLTEEPSRADML